MPAWLQNRVNRQKIGSWKTPGSDEFLGRVPLICYWLLFGDAGEEGEGWRLGRRGAWEEESE